MSIYAILSNNLVITCVRFNIAVLIDTKGDVNYLCDGTGEALFSP